MAATKPIASAPKATSPSPAAPPSPTQSAKSVALAQNVVPPKIALEETVRKAVEARKGTLVNALDTEHKAQVIREEEVRKGREKIDVLTAEIADMDAFLARS